MLSLYSLENDLKEILTTLSLHVHSFGYTLVYY